MADLAVYTTVYPGVEPYLTDWYTSLRDQTDQDFQLWVGIDQLTVDDLPPVLQERPEVRWVRAAPGDSHAQVRQRALERIVSDCSAVVLVDSDDVLHPSRVAAARESLAKAPVSGCALRLVDQHGTDLQADLTLPEGLDAEAVLPRQNIYGLSNTVYSCAALRACLPLPRRAALVDWFLVTRAWLRGIPLSFDRVVRMDYRQHSANTAQVLPPFAPDRVIADTTRVQLHFEVVRASIAADDRADRVALVEAAAEDVSRFKKIVVHHPALLQRYVDVLNTLPLAPLWWSSVAHPALQHLWTTDEEPG